MSNKFAERAHKGSMERNCTMALVLSGYLRPMFTWARFVTVYYPELSFSGQVLSVLRFFFVLSGPGAFETGRGRV